jgi:hypothetical protein
MDDLGLNKYLLETYGKTPEGLPYFKLSWTTNYTEHRYGTFTDWLGDIPVRTISEVREVPKYPFAEDRWVLERIRLVNEEARQMGLRTDSPYSYEEIYIFQDRQGDFLPLSKEVIEAAMYLFFKHYLSKTPKERMDMHIKALAERDMKRKQKTKEILGEGRSPLFIVME